MNCKHTKHITAGVSWVIWRLTYIFAMFQWLKWNVILNDIYSHVCQMWNFVIFPNRMFACDPCWVYVKRSFYFSSFGLCRIPKKAPLNWLYIISASTFATTREKPNIARPGLMDSKWMNGSQASHQFWKKDVKWQLTYPIAWKVLFQISLRMQAIIS